MGVTYTGRSLADGVAATGIATYKWVLVPVANAVTYTGRSLADGAAATGNATYKWVLVPMMKLAAKAIYWLILWPIGKSFLYLWYSMCFVGRGVKAGAVLAWTKVLCPAARGIAIVGRVTKHTTQAACTFVYRK